MRCTSNCIKALVIALNLLFVAGGAVLVGLVVWIRLYRDSFVYYRILEDPSSSETVPMATQSPEPSNHQQQQHIPTVLYRMTVIFIVAVVVIIIVIGFFGCCGASVESICFLILCMILLVSVVIAEIMIATMGSEFKQKLYSDLLNRMKYQIQSEYNRSVSMETTADQDRIDDIERLTLAWNTMQLRFKCCGASGPDDFYLSQWYNQTLDTTGSFVPLTCCVPDIADPIAPVPRYDSICQTEALLQLTPLLQLTQEGASTSLAKELNGAGCHRVFVDFLDSYLSHPLLIAVFVFVIILQLIDLVLTFALILWIRMKLKDLDSSIHEYSDHEEEDEEEDYEEEEAGDERKEEEEANVE